MNKKFKIGFVFLLLVLFSFSVSGLTINTATQFKPSLSNTTYNFLVDTEVKSLSLNSTHFGIDNRNFSYNTNTPTTSIIQNYINSSNYYQILFKFSELGSYSYNQINNTALFKNDELVLLDTVNITALSDVLKFTEPANNLIYFKDELSNASLIDKDISIKYPDGTILSTTTDLEGKIIFNSFYNSKIQLGIYTITYISDDGYVTPTTFNTTTSIPPFNETIYLYKGRLNINIYNQLNHTLLNNSNITVNFISDLGQFSNITSTGVLNVNNITASDYEIEFKSDLFETSNYFISISNSSTQSLNAYLLPVGSEETILTFKDSNIETIIEGIDISIEQIINDEWVLINILTSDISGRVVFNYQEDAKYRFSTSKSGYADKIFTLDPIIFSSYNIWLDKTTTEPADQDYSGVNIKHYPSAFYDNQNNTITVYFISPDGAFQNYGFNVTYKGEIISKSGYNAIGEILTDTIYIENATIGERLILTYYYKLSSGEIKVYTLPYTIQNIEALGTFSYNKGETYGLGLFERTLIAVLIVIGVAGAAFLFGGLLAAGLLAMLVFGYITFIGFLSGWVTIPTMIIIFIVTSWGATR
jgi:hypothetical protein